MKRNIKLNYEFVEFIPENLKENMIYISLNFTTAMHKCCCGCGNKVVTPLSPRNWKLIFDGATVSFYPSIGNWSFECKSHYWIKENRVEWAEQWSQERIQALRMREGFDEGDVPGGKDQRNAEVSFWKVLKKWWP